MTFKMKHLILLRYLKEYFGSVSVGISDCRTRSTFKTCSAAGHVDSKTSANEHFYRSKFSVNFKYYAFKTTVRKNYLLLNRGFFRCHDQQAKWNDKKSFSPTLLKLSNLVLFHKKEIFQVALLSTSWKTHAQECTKIILDNIGNNEEKTDISLK